MGCSPYMARTHATRCKIRRKALKIRNKTLHNQEPICKILNTLITETHNRLRNYRTQLNSYQQSISTTINNQEMTALKEAISHTATQHRHKRHNDLQLKLKNCRQYCEKYSNTTENWVKNISSRKLTDEELHLLSKGMNYNTKDARHLDFIADLEHVLESNKIEEHTANKIRHEIASHLKHH